MCATVKTKREKNQEAVVCPPNAVSEPTLPRATGEPLTKEHTAKTKYDLRTADTRLGAKSPLKLCGIRRRKKKKKKRHKKDGASICKLASTNHRKKKQEFLKHIKQTCETSGGEEKKIRTKSQEENLGER